MTERRRYAGENKEMNGRRKLGAPVLRFLASFFFAASLEEDSRNDKGGEKREDEGDRGFAEHGRTEIRNYTGFQTAVERDNRGAKEGQRTEELRQSIRGRKKNKRGEERRVRKRE